MWWPVLSVTILLLDQITKKYMSAILPLCDIGYCDSIIVLPVFKFELYHNSGAAFSFLSDQGGWQRWFLLGISTIVSGVLFAWLLKLEKNQKILILALSLILGGALGNLMDRLFLGYVVDFIVVHYDGHYFPAFNLADSAITLGAGFLILEMFIHPSETEKSDHQVEADDV